MQTRRLMAHLHKNIRLHRGRYIGRATHFVTICCDDRRTVFAHNPTAFWLIEILKKQSALHGFAVQAFCVMPDHFHALVTGQHDRSNLLDFVKNFKQTTSREYRRRQATALWQKKFFDHILKPNDDALAVRGYIWMNPVRKGLCVDPRDYPLSGSFAVDWNKELKPVEEWTPGWKRATQSAESTKAPD